jgi:hypothetical protein
MKVESSAPRTAEISIEKNPAVIEFARRVSALDGVRCVIAEPEDGAIHLTTFATPLTEEAQTAIYDVEDSLIDDYPDFLFDFHLKDAADYFGDTPANVPGEQFVWGSLDADSRPAPQSVEG